MKHNRILVMLTATLKFEHNDFGDMPAFVAENSLARAEGKLNQQLADVARKLEVAMMGRDMPTIRVEL